MHELLAADLHVWGLNSLQWSVVGVLSTVGALLVAAGAAVVAVRQYRLGDTTRVEQATETERTRREHAEEAERTRVEHATQVEAARLDDARPYVLLTVDTGEVSGHMLDVVLSNVGKGPARDVQISVDPPLRRAREDQRYPLHEARVFTEPIEMLPPGFRQRMFFDSAVDRHHAETSMPARHQVHIKYHDGHGHSWDEDSTLDVELMAGALYTDVLGVHHVAQALREVRDLLRKADNLAGPVETVVEERATFLERRERERSAQQAAMDAFTARMAAGPDAGPPPTDSTAAAIDEGEDQEADPGLERDS